MLKFGFHFGKKNTKEEDEIIKKNKNESTQLKLFDKLSVGDIHAFNLNDLIFENALHIAILDDNKEKIDNLLQSKKNNINKKDSIKQYTPLHLAVYLNDIALTNQILTVKNLNIDEIDIDNKTALIIASMMGNSHIIQTLLNHRSSINCTDNIGCTALHYTILNNDKDSFGLILERKPNLNFIDKSGYSYLHHTILLKRLEMSKELIKAKINVNIVDKNDQIPLHLAYIQKQDTIVNLLLENGSYTRKVDAFGKIPSDYKQTIEEKELKETTVLFDASEESLLQELENEEDEEDEENYDESDNDSSLISFESSLTNSESSDSKKNIINENTNNDTKYNKNYNKNNNKNNNIDINKNKQNEEKNTKSIINNDENNDDIIEKLNQPIIKIISHKKNNNLKATGSDHNSHDNDNLTSELSISTFSYSTNLINDDDDIDKDISYSSDLWDEFSVLNKDKKTSSNGDTLEESRISVTAAIKHVLNDEYEETENDLSIMDEVKHIPELLSVPQNEIGSIEYLNPESKEVTDALNKQKYGIKNSKSNIYQLNNNDIMKEDNGSIYKELKSLDINKKGKGKEVDDTSIAKDKEKNVGTDDIEDNDKDKSFKYSNIKNIYNLKNSNKYVNDDINQVDENYQTESSVFSFNDGDSGLNSKESYIDDEEESDENKEKEEENLSNEKSEKHNKNNIIDNENKKENNKKEHYDLNKNNNTNISNNDELKLEKDNQYINNNSCARDRDSSAENYSVMKKNPISKVLFNVDLGIDIKNKKTVTHKELSDHKIINKEKVYTNNTESFYDNNCNINDTKNDLFRTEKNINYDISETNEYSEPINDSEHYNENNMNTSDDSDNMDNTEIEMKEKLETSDIVTNSNNKVDFTISEEIISNNGPISDTDYSSSFIRNKREYEELKKKGILLQDEIYREEELLKSSKRDEEDLKKAIIEKFMNKKTLNNEQENINKSIISNNDQENIIGSISTKIKDSKIVENIYMKENKEFIKEKNINENENSIKNENDPKYNESVLNYYDNISHDVSNLIEDFSNLTKDEIITKLKIILSENNQMKELHKTDVKQIDELKDNISHKLDDYYELYTKYQDIIKNKTKEEKEEEKEISNKIPLLEESLKTQNKKLKSKIKHYENVLKNNRIEITEEEINETDSIKDETELFSFSITNNKTYELDDTIDILNNEINDKNGFIENLEKKVKDQQKIIDDYEMIMEQNNKEKGIYISNLEKNLDEANEKNSSFLNKLNEYEAKINEKNKENNELLRTVREIEEKRKSTIEKYDDLEQRMEENEKKMKELKNENNSLDVNLREANKNVSYLKNEIKDLEEKNKELSKELVNCQQSNESLNNQFSVRVEQLKNSIKEEEAESIIDDKEELFQRYNDKSMIELMNEMKSDPPHKIEEMYCLTSIIITNLEDELKDSRNQVNNLENELLESKNYINDLEDEVESTKSQICNLEEELQISKTQLNEERSMRKSISIKQNQNIKSINELEKSLYDIQNLYKEQMSINQENENEIKSLLKKLSYSNTQIEDIQTKLTDQQEIINIHSKINEKTKDLEQKNKDSQIQIKKLSKIIEHSQSNNAFIERQFDEFFKMLNEKLTAFVKDFCENNIKENNEKKKDNNNIDDDNIKGIIKENSELKRKLNKISSNILLDDDDNYNINNLVGENNFIESDIINSIDDCDNMSKDDIINKLLIILQKYKYLKEQYDKLQNSYDNLEKTYEILQNNNYKKQEKINEYEQEKDNLMDRIQKLEESLIHERNYKIDCDQLKKEIISKDKELDTSLHCINEMKMTLETITSNSRGMQKELNEKDNIIENYTHKINQLNNEIIRITSEIEMKNKSNEDIRISYENANSKNIKDLENLKSTHSNILNELDSLRKQYNELQEKYNKIIEENTNSVLSSEKQKSEFELRMNAQINENALLSAKNSSLESIIKKQEQDIEEINKKKDQLSSQFNDERLKNEKLNGEIKKLMIEIEYGENERKNIYNTKTQIDIEYSTLKNEYDTVNQKLKKYEEENKRISNNHSDMENKTEELNKKIEESNQKIDDLQAKYDSVKSTLELKCQENENLKISLEDFIHLGMSKYENDENDSELLRIKSLDDIRDIKDYSRYSRSLSKKIEKDREDLINKIDQMKITIKNMTTENNLIKNELTCTQNRIVQIEEEKDKLQKSSENKYNKEKENYNDSINEKDKEINRLREYERNSQLDIERLKDDLQKSKLELEESQKKNKEMESSLSESLQKINMLMNEESKNKTDIDYLNKDIIDREKKLQKQLEDIEENKQEAIKYKNQIKELKKQIDIIFDEKANLERKLKLEIRENEVNLKIEKSKVDEYERQMKDSNLKNNELVKDINIKYDSLKTKYDELNNLYDKQCTQVNLLWKCLSPTEEILDNKDILSLKEYLEKELTQKNNKINNLQQTCDCYQEQKETITKNYKNILQQFKDNSIKQIEEKCKENEKLKKDIEEIKEEYAEKEKKMVKLFDEKVKDIADQLKKQTEERQKVDELRNQQMNEMKESYTQKIQTLQQKVTSLKESLHTIKENNKQEKRELENLISKKNMSPCTLQSQQPPSQTQSLPPQSANVSSIIPNVEKDLDDNKENVGLHYSKSTIYSNESNNICRNKYSNGILLHNVNKKPYSNVLRSCLSEVNENNLRELKLQKVYNSCCNLHLQPNLLNKSLSKEIQEMRQRLNINKDNDGNITRKQLLEMDNYLLENDDMIEGFKTTDMLKKKLSEFEIKYA